MREYGVPRNTLRDYLGICVLKIIDTDKYTTVTQQEKGKSGKASVKCIEKSCRLALREYWAQANKMKGEGKLLPLLLRRGLLQYKRLVKISSNPFFARPECKI